MVKAEESWLSSGTNRISKMDLSASAGHCETRRREPGPLLGEFGSKLRAEGLIRKRVKPQLPVVGGIPRDVGEGGQRQPFIAAVAHPRGNGIDQVCSDALTGMIWVDADLLEVSAPVALDG